MTAQAGWRPPRRKTPPLSAELLLVFLNLAIVSQPKLNDEHGTAVLADETAAPDWAYLMKREEGGIRLMDFGDANRKRNATDVVQHIMNYFFNKRNQVYPVLWQDRPAVEKHFSNMEDWNWESALYAVLKDSLTLPEVLEDSPGLLVTAYVPAPTLLEELRRQAVRGFDPNPWQALADWLIRCHGLCGRLPSEGGLRNFLWDDSAKKVIGLNLESFREESLSLCGARLISCLMSDYPGDTEVKTAAAALLQERLLVSEEAVRQEYDGLQIRRAGGFLEPVSGIVLAGGRSKRMGQDKAGLPLCRKTLLEWQVEKMQALGIRDIIISGAAAPDGTCQIEDIYPDRGPLGGLHACLQQAQNPACLVLCVDIPLVPPSALEHLRRSHRQGVTVLTHNGCQEPLLGMYDSNLSEIIEPLIKSGGASVRKLEDHTEWKTFEYRGPEEFLRNCNYPEDYISVCGTAIRYAEKSFPLL